MCFRKISGPVCKRRLSRAPSSRGPGGNRYWETTQTTGSTIFGSDGFERTILNGVTTYRHELGPVVFTSTKVNGAAKPTYMLHDRLGSVLAEVDVYGNDAGSGPSAVATRMYDAFGKTRNADFTDRQGGMLNLRPITLRGFTGQESVDEVQMIHMNGRIYDYNLGRFLGVDPIIGNPLSSQSLNPYSYIGNNPLSGTDPTGYVCHSDGDRGNVCEGKDKKEKDGGVAQRDKIDNFRAATDWSGRSGASGQGASSGNVKAESIGSSGDRATKGSRNAASGDYNGSGQQAQELDTINVTAPSFGRVLWNSIITNLELLNPWDDYYYDGISPVNPREPTRHERLEAQLAQQAAHHPVAEAAGSAIVTLATVIVFPEGAEEEAALGTARGAGEEVGSYTNLHESGRTYSGKGTRARSQASGRRIERQ